MKLTGCVLAFVVLFSSGCGNNPTSPENVPTPYVSAAPYEPLDCSQLAIELGRLNSVERELVQAQKNRLEQPSNAVWNTYGLVAGIGDGMETVELAKMRGKRDAVRRTQVKKGCKE
jgi:hypothetical protein